MIRKLLIVPVILVLGLFFTAKVYAAELSNRQVFVANPIAGSITEHIYSFTVPTSSIIGSMRFQYCADSPNISPVCSVPVGLDVSGASLSAESGITGFSVDGINTTANDLVITRVPAFSASTTVTYTFSSVINPSTPSTSTYVRIMTYATTDGTGAYTDSGSVVFSTEGQFSTTGFVPPYLTACVGVTVAIDCSSTAGTLNNFGELSTVFAAATTSQFSAATNDPLGYVGYIQGSTMTSGNNTITALATPAASNPGTSQFGINVRANAAPTVGAEPQGVGTAVAQAGYSSPNQFSFVSGSAVVATNLSTEFNRFTVSYIVNVPSSQPSGYYAATFTYIFVAAF